jgi:hypothetical protein
MARHGVITGTHLWKIFRAFSADYPPWQEEKTKPNFILSAAANRQFSALVGQILYTSAV